ncbi:MAG: thiamine pyrophosphate-dependent enzyme, partial [Chloroflexota bacterium]
YVCENNMYNEYTHYSETTAGELMGRAEAFGIHTEEVDGQDVRQVYLTALKLVERARSGGGPAFLLANTYRFYGHHVGDINRTYYRSKEEEAEWKTNRDPLKNMGAWLIEQEIADDGLLDGITAEVEKEAEDAVAFAIDAPYPPEEEVDSHVFAS